MERREVVISRVEHATDVAALRAQDQRGTGGVYRNTRPLIAQKTHVMAGGGLIFPHQYQYLSRSCTKAGHDYLT